MIIQPLTCINQYQSATVVKIKLTDQEQIHLAQLGVRCGISIKVLQNAGQGPLLIAIGDGRIGLNYQMAQKIFVSMS